MQINEALVEAISSNEDIVAQIKSATLGTPESVEDFQAWLNDL